MQQDKNDSGFDELSTPEKILHVQDLWDRIALRPEQVEPTDAQRAEIERRLRVHDTDPGTYTSWDDLRRRLEEREE